MPDSTQPSPPPRQSTGVPRLDEMLGGGLIPGTLTIVLGATGIGKTQLGVQYANAGLDAENRRGVIYDLTIRGDSQSHAEYAQRICQWGLHALDPNVPVDHDQIFPDPQSDTELAEYFKVFSYRGQSSREHPSDFHPTDRYRDDQYRADLLRKLSNSIAFFYQHFTHGVRRTVIDGIDPNRNPRGTIQFDLIEYVYQQILKKPAEWVARDLFREKFRSQEKRVLQNLYPAEHLGCMLLGTSNETMLDQLIERSLNDDDWLAVANTIIMIGRVRNASGVQRALHIAKHRGSACSDQIIPFTIDEAGIQIA